MSDNSKFETANYTQNDHNRFWFWRIPGIAHDPLIYHFLDDKEKALLKEWYIETEEKELIGECTPPMVSLLSGFFGGNIVTRVVQLGHYAGYSSLLLGVALKKMTGGKLYTIDISEPMTDFTRGWINKFDLQDTVHAEVSDSAAPAVAEKAKTFLGGAPQAVIIDSSHTYDHTIKELDLWMPQLVENGFIFLHDASEVAKEYDPEKGAVAGALKDWCKANDYNYFVLNGGDVTPAESHSKLVYRDGRGLGIIQKRRG